MNKPINSYDVNQKKVPSSKPISENYSSKVPFQNFFDDALSATQKKEPNDLNYNFNYKKQSKVGGEELIAQAANVDQIDNVLRNVEQAEQQAREDQIVDSDQFLDTQRVNITPFQFFIDKAIEVLESVSQLDYRVNDLTEKYIKGEVSIDEVSVETMKLNLAVSFVTTVLSSATQAFKEITQLAI